MTPLSENPRRLPVSGSIADDWTVIVKPHGAYEGMWYALGKNPFYGTWEVLGLFGCFDHALRCAKAAR